MSTTTHLWFRGLWAVLLTFGLLATANAATPTISGNPPTSIAVGSTYSFTPSASDRDRNTRLRFSISNMPRWMSFDSNSGRLSGKPTNSNVGTYRDIRITVSDGRNKDSLRSFTITVKAATNTAPTISGTPATSVKAGSSYSFTPTASDANGDALSFTVQNKPSWATINVSNGRLSGTPSSSNVGTYSNIVISVSDGKTSTPLKAFSITVASAVTNTTPTISGTPSTTVQAGSRYSFTPTASDADGQKLTFTITGKPVWAAFDSATGALTGTPDSSRVGTYSNIKISVSDGSASRSLTAFAINVTAVGSGSGAATLSWYAPTQNTDGSALTNLSGYKAYHGTSANSLTDVRTISSPGITTFVFEQLPAGTHYFAVAAVNAAGVESARSAVVSKVIR